MDIYSIGYYWLVFLAFILGRYFLIAGGAFWLFYPSKIPFLSWMTAPKPQWKFVQQDISLSIASAFLFALLSALIMSVYNAGGTRIYSSIDTYGWWYMGLSFWAVLVLQDTYFYFTHRLLHHPRLFKRMHYGHHRSRVPTPWTSFAFEPSEALLHGIFFVSLVFVMPLHFIVLIAAFITMTIWAMITHLGFELIPPGVSFGGLEKGLIGPAHHAIHHRQYRTHFGLYFTFWDRVLGTTDPDYAQTYLSK